MAKLSNDKKNINFYYYNRFKVKSKDLSCKLQETSLWSNDI